MLFSFFFKMSFVCSSSVSIIGSNQKSLHMKSVETQIVTLVLVHNKAQECCVFLKLLRPTDKADFPPRNHPINRVLIAKCTDENFERTLSAVLSKSSSPETEDLPHFPDLCHLPFDRFANIERSPTKTQN